MLETERHNTESEPDGPAATGQDGQETGGQRRGLLRRVRRAVTRPAGPPADDAGTRPAQSGTAAPVQSGAGQSGAGQSGAGQFSAGQAGPAATDRPAQAVPPIAFQPPVVIFQPPDIGTSGGTGTGRQHAGDAGGPDGPGDGEARPPSRRRSSSRPAGAAGSHEDAAGPGGPGAGHGGADQSGAGQSGAGQSADGYGAAGQAGDGQGGQSRTRNAHQAAADQDDDAEQSPAGTRRRRRGGRGHGRSRAEDDGAEAAQPSGREGDAAASAEGGAPEADYDDDDAGDAGDGTARPARRRRRRRRTGPGGDGDALAPDDPPDTVVHVRPQRQATDNDDVRSVKGSTRLEAKRQRRREGRDSGRRRPPIITESEFLARREAVERVMVVRQTGERTQIAVLEDGVLVEHYVDKASHQSYVGNVYLGKVQNVLPSMEAAFVDIGKGRNAVLYAGEVNFDASGLEGESKRIESALKSGQSILVQVTKDPIGHKGARLTSQISLPGRYLVYVPGSSMTGISRKLPDTERSRLKQILKQVMPEDAGVIVRTAAEGASEVELAHDVARLSAQWEAIERKSKTATSPDLLYSEPDLTIRVVRDIFNEDFTKLVIASSIDWDMVDEYIRYVAPDLADRLERWSGDTDVFGVYRIDEQLAKALDRKVWLPSGGSLVIDATEAMTVIDVNTGKFTGQGGNLEQTVTRNNLEAAEEIVRQLRLRDVGGIIVIDFIDMVLESNRELVLRRLLECLARDRTKHQVAEVTSLGLVQMTRKRVGSGLLEAFSVPCEHCNGRGVIISLDLVDHAPRPRSDNDRGGKDDRKPNGRPARGGRRGGPSAPAAVDALGAAAVRADDGVAADDAVATASAGGLGGNDRAGSDQAGRDQAGRDQVGRDQAGRDQAGNEYNGGVQAGEETGRAPRSRSSRSRSGRSRAAAQAAATAEPPAAQAWDAEPPTAELPIAGLPTAESPSADLPTAGPPTAGALSEADAVAGATAGGQSADRQSGGGQPGGRRRRRPGQASPDRGSSGQESAMADASDDSQASGGGLADDGPPGSDGPPADKGALGNNGAPGEDSGILGDNGAPGGNEGSGGSEAQAAAF